jgi:replication factor C subunit 3/5
MPKLDDSMKAEIVKWSAFYEHRIRMGSKVIFHLEAFVAKFMRIYERYADRAVLDIRKLTISSSLLGMDLDDFDD